MQDQLPEEDIKVQRLWWRACYVPRLEFPDGKLDELAKSCMCLSVLNWCRTAK
ncbi:hypothetical protein LDENG_00176600 [Lucifuga dentata]|nr:hypothetical protein LDENG_00176600 [Lucifuga dentata]